MRPVMGSPFACRYVVTLLAVKVAKLSVSEQRVGLVDALSDRDQSPWKTAET
jgi:hypothetical protein